MIGRRIALLALALSPTAAFAWPWSSSEKVAKPDNTPAVKSENNVGVIQVKDIANDPPEFKRQYSVPLPRGLKLIIEAKTDSYYSFSHEREYTCTINQPDGKYVLFLIEEPADKIIDADLIQPVIDACKMVRDWDDNYVKNLPDRFVDTNNVTWQRVKSS